MSAPPEDVDFPARVVVRRDASLARHTAWRCGGSCDAFVVVHRREALADAIRAIRASGWKWTLLGAGTRTVVRDGGLAGAVLRLGTDFAQVKVDADGWWVGAATPVPAIVSASVAAGRDGLAELAAVPGSMGAAVALEDGDWTDHVDGVRVFERGRELVVGLPDVRARVVAGKSVLVTEVRLTLPPASSAAVRDAVLAVMRQQTASPWFVAPDGDPITRHLHRAGVAGARLRRVSVPRSAPEMMVALAPQAGEDLELLGQSVVDKVKRHAGIALDTCVRFAGRRVARDSR